MTKAPEVDPWQLMAWTSSTAPLPVPVTVFVYPYVGTLAPSMLWAAMREESSSGGGGKQKRARGMRAARIQNKQCVPRGCVRVEPHRAHTKGGKTGTTTRGQQVIHRVLPEETKIMRCLCIHHLLNGIPTRYSAATVTPADSA